MGYEAAKSIAIIGSGPTALYTLFELIQRDRPVDLTIFERGKQAGVGMPYDDSDNNRMMLANIASIEIPPIAENYLDWIKKQPESFFARYQVDRKAVHERQFFPRLMLGEYFRDQFLWLERTAKERGFRLTVHEDCEVTDVAPDDDGVWVQADAMDFLERFDIAVIATGHVFPDDEEATRSYFPSPWSGLVDAEISACNIGILGTSLSAIDAAMAVVIQHGHFLATDGGNITFYPDESSANLAITMMSRSGVLPEADFYCPIPYEPLQVATRERIEAEIGMGGDSLLDRVFSLVVEEIKLADPGWSARMGLDDATADDLAERYFADRKMHDPFRWAAYNLAEVEQNKAAKITVAWRYAILRLHEVVQEIVPALTEDDRARFDAGIKNVFVDNYAAVPSESIRRMLALRQAGIISLLDTGDDYDKFRDGDQTVLVIDGTEYRYDVYIDARGQRPMKSKDIPFPSLRRLLVAHNEDIPSVGDDYALLEPEVINGRIAFAAIPYLIHDNPFIQGITASAEIGGAIGRGIMRKSERKRRVLDTVIR